MTKPVLNLARDNNAPGLWQYSYGAPEGGTVKGQVAVPPDADRETEKAAALAKIKAVLRDVLDRLEAEER